MHSLIEQREKTIAVIGLGYVGLPIALAFARKVNVIGFDINESRVKMMQQHKDPSNELTSDAFENCSIQFTCSVDDLKAASFYIVAVPTPIDQSMTPNLKPLLSASETVGRVIGKGDYVVFESTVYPGCTEEDCLPIIEDISGLKRNVDFKFGYSPERINPGDKERTIEKIVKVVSGGCEESAEEVAKVYDMIIDAGVFRASSVRVAEAAKVIENTQRDLNIALMNELSIIFDKMNIPTADVLEAAGTKWNFLRFFPGLVGGHCIGVDPYYLTFKAQKLGYNPQVILSGRRINDNMSKHVATKLVQKLLKKEKSLKAARVLVMGVTFKENVSDIRNSKVADLIHALKEYSLDVDIIDQYADSEEVMNEYGFALTDKAEGPYDGIIAAVSHNEYRSFVPSHFKSLMNDDGILFDLKNMYKGKEFRELDIWSL